MSRNENFFKAAINTLLIAGAVRGGMNPVMPFNPGGTTGQRDGVSSSLNTRYGETSEAFPNSGVSKPKHKGGGSFGGNNLGSEVGVSFKRSDTTQGFATGSTETKHSRESASRNTNRRGNVYDSGGDAFGYHYLGAAHQTIELLEHFGLDTYDLQKDLDELSGEEGVSKDKVGGVLTGPFSNLFASEGATEKFADRVAGLNEAERQKLADLKEGALDKFGLGVFRDIVVDSDSVVSMQSIRDESAKLNHLVNQAVKGGWSPGELVEKSMPHLVNFLKDLPSSGEDNEGLAVGMLLGTSVLAAGTEKRKKYVSRAKKILLTSLIAAIFLTTCTPSPIAGGTPASPTSTSDIQNSAPATEAIASPSPEPTEAPRDLTCGRSPGTELFAGGYKVGKAVPVLSNAGFDSLQLADSDVVKTEITSEVARRVHEVALAGFTGRVVIPEFANRQSVIDEVNFLRSTLELPAIDLPFQLVNFSQSAGISNSDTLLIAPHLGEAGREIGLWKESRVIERPDGSFAIDGLLHLVVGDGEGNWYLYMIPAQKIGGRADIAIVDGCEPVIVRVEGDVVTGLLDSGVDLVMLQGDPDLLWLDRDELASVPPIPVEPTATMPPFQETANGVQIFENGRYINLQAPEGLWGNIDGMKVVLQPDENGEMVPFAQMTLENGFVDTDGDNIINIAKYSKAAKKWTSVPFSFARTPEWVDGYNSRNYVIEGKQKREPIDVLRMGSILLGVNFDPTDHESPVELLVRYKGRVARLVVNELSADDRSVEPWKQISADPGKIDLANLLQVVDVLIKSNPSNEENGLFLNWFFPASGAKLEDCSQRSNTGAYVIPEFAQWCIKEIAKGPSRKILTKEEIESAVLFNDFSFLIGSRTLDNPNELWLLTKSLILENGWLAARTWHK